MGIPNIFFDPFRPVPSCVFSLAAWHMPGKNELTSPCWRQVELLVDQQPDATIFYEIQGLPACRTPGNQTWLAAKPRTKWRCSQSWENHWGLSSEPCLIAGG